MATSSPRIKMVYTVALIRGFYFGPRRPTGLIDVAVNHHAVDCGYSIPTLEPWLTAPYKIQSALYHGDCADTQYKIYFQLPGESHANVVAEFIIFSLSVLDQRLVSVSTKEEGLYNVLEAFLTHSPEDFPAVPMVTDKIIELHTLQAFYFGDHQQPGIIDVETAVYNINYGFHIPMFATVFYNPVKIVTSIFRRNHRSRTFAIYLSTSQDSAGKDEREMLVFRQKRRGILQCVRTCDMRFVIQAVLWFFNRYTENGLKGSDEIYAMDRSEYIEANADDIDG